MLFRRYRQRRLVDRLAREEAACAEETLAAARSELMALQLDIDQGLIGKPRTHPICPECGAMMRVRTARRTYRNGSQFWGCSRYPACTATLPLGAFPAGVSGPR
jgi:Topoisomerase DNA binding C4 zinc finger